MNSGASNNNLDQLNAIILEQAPDAIVVIDEQLRLIKANHKAYQLFGYSQKELIGMPINQLDGLMNASMIGSVVQKVKSEGSVTFESKALHKNGVLIPLEIKACFVDFGEQSYLIAFARNITERANAREALEKEKGFMDALMDNVPESIFFKDNNSRLTRVSKKLMHDLNCTDTAELIGKTDIEIFGEEFGRKTMAIERQILKTGEPHINMMEQRYQEDGTIVWTLTTKAPIKDETGAATGIVGIAREINEIKEREEQLQAKEAQLSIASHIAGLGYWEFNVDEGFYTFNDHFYRIFHTSVGEVVQHFKPDVEHRNFEWKIEKLPVVQGDNNLLKIVFENLLSNAIKYTRNCKHAIVEVGILNSNEHPPTVFVKDNGVGFDMAYADKLFGVFQRLHREEDFEGTGIGLANVHQIIKKHGGTVRAVGEINKGATFYLTF